MVIENPRWRSFRYSVFLYSPCTYIYIYISKHEILSIGVRFFPDVGSFSYIGVCSSRFSMKISNLGKRNYTGMNKFIWHRNDQNKSFPQEWNILYPAYTYDRVGVGNIVFSVAPSYM